MNELETSSSNTQCCGRSGEEVLLEDVAPHLLGIPLRAATPEKLVQYLVNTFRCDGEISSTYSQLPRVLFLMHRWFIPSVSLAFNLVQYYRKVTESELCTMSNCQHLPIEFNHVPRIIEYQTTTVLHDSSSTDDSSTIECLQSPGDVSTSRTSPMTDYDQSPTKYKIAVSSCVNTQQTIDVMFKDCDGVNTQPCLISDHQARIVHAFRYWILNFPLHFHTEDGLMCILKEFQNTLPKSYSMLIDLSQIPSYDWMRNISVRQNCKLFRSKSCKVSLLLMSLNPTQLAALITFLEHKIVRRITFHDYKKYCTSGSLKETPKLDRSVALFNGLTHWIQCLVLSRTTPQQRADVITKFIYVAQKLLELRNYNSLMSVVGSISHSVLARLTKTISCLSPESKKCLAELTDLLSSSNNFSNYRRSLADTCGFKIPILGIHLKDMISLNTALPNLVDGNMINVRKMIQLSTIFQDLENMQMSSIPLDVNMDHVKTLTLSLDMCYSEDEIYELSLAREPRNLSSPQISPTQQVLFADWAANTCSPPEPQTIEKHVNAMVEAVFKNYDCDRDGYISHEEFDTVAGNFPFIASFCVLDADHDGMISKTEMTKYFIQANCHLLKSGFKHDFHETTYFKPTFCAHCTGLLWGLIRQGYKCRDCSINAHKHCKDLVVMECRIRNIEPNQTSSLSRRRFRRKKKSSVSEADVSPTGSSKNLNDDNTTISSDCSDTTRSGGSSLPPSPRPNLAWGPKRKISDSLLVPSRTKSASKLRTQHSCPETSFHHIPATSSQYKPSIVVTRTNLQRNTSLNIKETANEPRDNEKPLFENFVANKPFFKTNFTSEIKPFLKDFVPQELPHTSTNTTNDNNNQDNNHYQDVEEKLRLAEEINKNLEKENSFLLQQLETAYQELNSLREHVGEVREQTIAFILSQMETLRIQKNTHV